MPLPRPRLSRLALCLAAALATPTYADDLLQQAEQLLSQQKGAEAYALLAPQEDERGGDPAYDLALGRAALAAGRHTEAAFAFERCLATDPKNGPCRMNMAQAHMLLGETDSARIELKTIQDYNPPPEVQNLVNQYMGLLEQQEQKKDRHVGLFAQLTFGQDSNVNSATDEKQVAIPLFGNLVFDLQPGSREQDDTYTQLEAGATLQQRLNPAWTLLADASVSQRLHNDIDALDSLILNASGGAAWRTGPSQIVLKASAQDYQLDGEDFRQILGGMVQYLYSPSDLSQVSTFLQVADISYDPQPTRDSRRDTVGVAWSQALTWWRQPVVYAGLYGGQETLDDDASAALENRFVGLRAGAGVFLTSKLQLNASLSVEDRGYEEDEILFQDTRDDTQTDVSLGLAYRLGSHFSIRPTYTYTDNGSNIVINDFTRHVFSVDFRYER